MAKITNTQDLNKALIECLDDIMGVGSSTKGNKFDETVRDKLKKHLLGAKYIESGVWGAKNKKNIYYKHKQLTLQNKFDFNGLPPVDDNGDKLNLMIIDKPNGSQKWPDLLVIFNGVGLPIEIKSAKPDRILWNGGTPKHDSIYIFNCYGKSKTTCFLGQYVANDEELRFLTLKADYTKQFNEVHENGRWGYYVRNMYNSNQSFFENDDYNKKTTKNITKNITELEIRKTNLENKLEKRVSDGRNNKIYDLKIKIDDLKIKIDALNNDKNVASTNYNKVKDERLSAERQTKDMILNLTWDSKQKSVFTLDDYEVADVEAVEDEDLA